MACANQGLATTNQGLIYLQREKKERKKMGLHSDVKASRWKRKQEEGRWKVQKSRMRGGRQQANTKRIRQEIN